MIRRTSVASLVSVAFLSATVARGQSLCAPTETISRCRERLQGELKPSVAKDEAKTPPADAASKTETGIADLSGLSSTIKDFVPLLQLTGALGAVQKDETTGAVSIALNTPFVTGSGKLTKDPSLQVKVVVETKPKLFDKLKAQLPATERDALEARLLATRPDADDVTLHASYSFTSRRLGRNFATHTALYDTLFEEAVSGPLENLSHRDAEIARELDKVLRQAGVADLSIDEALWEAIPERTRRDVESIILRGAQMDQALATAFRAAVDRPGLNLFGQLVNNQPQLYVTVYRTLRDDLYGPDLLSGRVTFEMGLGNNLNAVFDPDEYKECKGAPMKCLEAYAARVKDPELQASIKAGNRLTASVEFIQNHAYHFTNADPGVDLSIAKGTSWTASIEYGRLFGVSDSGVADGRVDASVKYEAPPSGAGDRRFVASLTITKKLGEVSIPFGIVYANKPKFLMGVDKGLGANVGLKFNLF